MQVEGLIAYAADLLTSRLGVVETDAPCWSGFCGAQRLLAAMWVELSYFPEQVRTERSPYEEYRLQFDQQVEAVVACLEGNQPGVDPTTPAGWAAYSVPTNPPYPRDASECLPAELIANWNPPIDVEA